MSANHPSSVFTAAASAAGPEPILSGNLAAVRSRVQKTSTEIRWALAGLLLAQVMVVLLYLILVNNIDQLKNKRLAAEQSAREHHRCAMMQNRLARDQCLVAAAQPQSADGPVLAER